MAKMQPGFPFTGTINGLSYYKMRGVEEIVVRQKGGPSGKRVKTDKAFANTRRNNAEFGGRSTASKWIMKMLFPMKALADNNIAGNINAMLIPIQELDTSGEWGSRSILFSANSQLLAGYSLNVKNQFDSIVRNPLAYELDRNDLKAIIHLPALLPGINFFVPWKYPLFSFQASLGIVPDLFYNNKDGIYKPQGDYEKFSSQTISTAWFPVSRGSAATVLELSYPHTPPDQSFAMLLSLGIRYGNPGDANNIGQIKYAGAAKVLATG